MHNKVIICYQHFKYKLDNLVAARLDYSLVFDMQAPNNIILSELQKSISELNMILLGAKYKRVIESRSDEIIEFVSEMLVTNNYFIMQILNITPWNYLP